MKSTKQNARETKQKRKDSSVPKIQNYFKSAPKVFLVGDKGNVGIHSENFYAEALKQKLREVNAVSVAESEVNQDDVNVDNSNVTVVSVAELELNQDNANADNSSEHIGAHAVIKANDAGTSDQIGFRVARPNTARDCEGHAEQETECSRAECTKKAIECQEWERKYKELKKVYVNLTINYSEESIKYKNLLKAATRATQSDPKEVALSDDDIFTQKEINALERIPHDKRKDSTFILESLQFAYKSDLSAVCGKTLKGRSAWVEFTEDGNKIQHDGKNKLSPEKVDRIKSLFIDRISKCDIDSVEYGERIDETRVNKLFASGVKNITKKQNYIDEKEKQK